MCLGYALQAKTYLMRFSLLFAKIYGFQSLFFNAHALIHLADDVMFFQCSLSELIAFPFENLLGNSKTMVHSGRKPLQQLYRRLSEKFSISEEKVTIPSNFQTLRKKKGLDKQRDNVISCKFFDYTYSTLKSDNCVSLHSKEFVLIDKITGLEQNNIIINGKLLKIVANAYETPQNHLF